MGTYKGKMTILQQKRNLVAEVTCIICSEYFNEPVTTACGHTFCESCISRAWQRSTASFQCIICRHECKGTALKANSKLQYMAELVKEMNSKKTTAQGEHWCEEHATQLTLFCKNDQETICVLCFESERHRSHTVVRLEEAAPVYVNALERQLETLQEKEKAVILSADTDLPVTVALKAQRDAIRKFFPELQKTFMTEKKLLENTLKFERQEMQTQIRQIKTALMDHIRNIRATIKDIDEKCGESDMEMLGDVNTTFRRCDELKDPKYLKTSFPGLEENTMYLSQQKDSIISNMKELKESLIKELEWRSKRCFFREVSMDPATANCGLVLSEDRTCVTAAYTRANLPRTPWRHHTSLSVLGEQEITSGQHYWEVLVENGRDWSVGVCWESANRKLLTRPSPPKGFWVVSLADRERCLAHTSPTVTRLRVRLLPRVLGIFVDYEAGKVSFYHVEQRCPLFQFPIQQFNCTLRPYFRTFDAPLKLLPSKQPAGEEEANGAGEAEGEGGAGGEGAEGQVLSEEESEGEEAAEAEELDPA